ncbi:lysosomal-associated transmembrane protein 4B [Ahaetulla prasina]|uniref:lysosomal-associated transmembrane protein 4B n=1 Tax=Ahaetulla prasina TaxID=499056 RepID=UPI0026492A09|nr:lysosomal-associated transmembrane protein 4B [Ahaetulla prasina]
MKMLGSPWTRFYSNSCCLCCHVRTGTIILGVWYLILNAVVLLIILSALTDPGQYHLAGTELSNDFEFMDDANMCIATAVSLLMILICAMATYGAYKITGWRLEIGGPLESVVRFKSHHYRFARGTHVCPETSRQPANFPYKEEIMSMNSICLIVILLLCLSITLAFKAYLISCVWNCYRYINNRNNSDVLVYITTNDTAVLLPSYDDSANGPGKDAPPPPYVAA